MRKETKQIRLNIYPNDHEKIKDKAQDLGMTMAEYIRHLTNSKIVKDTRKKITQVEKDKLRELNRIGINLNQITKKLNTNNEVDYLVLKAIENIMESINKLELL